MASWKTLGLLACACDASAATSSGGRALGVAGHRLIDAELSEQRPDINAGVPESAHQLLHQAATLVRGHLLRGIGDPLLRLTRAQRLQRRAYYRPERALGNRVGDLVVVGIKLLLAEVAARDATEDAAELIEKGHDIWRLGVLKKNNRRLLEVSADCRLRLRMRPA